MTTVAIVPARGGSKRIPFKNIRPFAGVPLLVRTIDRLLESGIFDRIVVSTDNEDIADLARETGAEVPFVRPAALADDATPIQPVVKHALQMLEASGFSPSYVCCALPASALNDSSDFAKTRSMLHRPDVDYVFLGTPFPYPIQRALRLSPDETCSMVWPENLSVRSQDFETLYHDAGQFYWGLRGAWLEDRPVLGPRSRIFAVPRHRVVDIDTPDDWVIAERFYRMTTGVREERAARERGDRTSLSTSGRTQNRDIESDRPRDASPVMERIVLGTVQFGVPYGRRRKEARLRKDVVFRILDQAWELGIRRFDTAEAYGLAAPWLSEWLRTRRRTGTAAVITKLGIDQIADAGAVAMAVNLFAGVQSTTILSHDFTSAERWETLRDEALAEGARCGQSVYTAAEVQAAARLGAQRVQAPGNVFDFRTIRVGQAAGVPMDVRSVYLQGLLLETPEMADKRIPGSAPLVRAVHRAAAEIESTTASALLASALTQLGPLDRIVIGIDDASQLADISAAGEVPQASACSFGELLDGASTTEASALKLVLDPRYWN